MESIKITTLFFILFTHWVADFIVQTDWQAKNKSTNNRALFFHVLTYSSTMTLSLFLLDFDWLEKAQYTLNCWLFLFITFGAHFITDYFTSRLNTYLYSKNQIHWFFVSIGFDQILHYVQLIFTYLLLFNPTP